ncbi:GntR family transcriptional regulator [Cupriavidus basilensis]|uniref:GntR family transcriptional regulator n=1 Tax=Cupriavidus basilensis TaxID=68895 RepID=UPI000750C999|nr:GntR family transcriptional regulator [Cupriavidus basilensis]
MSGQGGVATRASRSQAAYHSLRDDIFAFRLLPGDRFTENDVAERLGISRTPVREALQRLQGDGLVRGHYRNGWEVVPLDLGRFEALYELRTVLETHAVTRLCQQPAARHVDLASLARQDAIWRVPRAQRLADGNEVARLDEGFHLALMHAAGNPEAAAVHQQVTDRIRIIRRLDFAYGDRVELTYDEHAGILDAVAARDSARAVALLASHIEDGRAEVSRLTTERLERIRTSLVLPVPPGAPPRRRRFG